MTPEKWDKILEQIQDKFKVEEQGQEHEAAMGGIDIDYIIFTGPLGRMKLEFITKPVVLDKKTTYSRRIGSETKVDYVYSDQEKSHKLAVFKWDQEADDWLEVEAGMFE